ncbi:hypothetical protein [Tepidimicrobium xylanilyticum]|uniref:Sorbitol phosphotransferase enzyme II C-terminus n=1 Tax=Tepidimicrobium xylanilyticum TaxID=1123352 RepID=A0A1H2W4P5_9FIRM|nr:hypothetical protein [Tepidimicrobium xylanilyticum]SDW75485.1 Sorbitol phosphotransferase enzyme II C-terminus [Tepidimicrobium xylanilyticum]
MKGMNGFISKVSSGIGYIVSVFIQSGRDAINMAISTILPFMIFVSAIVGVVLSTGLGDIIANGLSFMANSYIGLLFLGIICAFPLFSPILGPGAVIAQTIGVLIGALIAEGKIAPSLALPAIFAIHQPAGGDFVPVGLGLAEARPETAEVGVPAVLYGKWLVSPIEMLIAIVLSFGLYS